jgi:hypothetical protein
MSENHFKIRLELAELQRYCHQRRGKVNKCYSYAYQIHDNHNAQQHNISTTGFVNHQNDDVLHLSKAFLIFEEK